MTILVYGQLAKVRCPSCLISDGCGRPASSITNDARERTVSSGVFHRNTRVFPTGSSAVYPVFCLDPWFAGEDKVGKLRYAFLLEALADLDASLRALGNRLYVVKGSPETALPELWKRWSVNRMTYEEDTEPYALKRDASVGSLAEAAGVRVEAHAGHTLHPPARVLAKSKSGVPTTYTSFMKAFSAAGGVPRPDPAITASDIASTATSADPDDDEFGLVTLESAGYAPLKQPEVSLFPGGERAALKRLEATLSRPGWVRQFEKPKTSPNSLEPSTTVLSPYLKFGYLPAGFSYLISHFTLASYIYQAPAGRVKWSCGVSARTVT